MKYRVILIQPNFETCLDKEMCKYTENTNGHQLCNNHRINNPVIKVRYSTMYTVY